jgi:hypothetical protein
MEGIIDLHHDIVFFLIWVLTLVTFLMIELILGNVINSNFSKIFQLSQIKNFEFFTNKSKVVSHKILVPKKIQHNTFLEIV